MPTLHPDGLTAYLRAYGDHAPPPGTLIRCGRCGTHRHPDEFYITACLALIARGGRPTGPYSRCRTCTSADMRARLASKRAVVAEAKAGGCVDCGIVNTDHPEIFDFDHVRPGKVKTVTAWVTSGTVEQMRAEMARCEVVCSNCHRIRTKAREHGGRKSDIRRRMRPPSPTAGTPTTNAAQGALELTAQREDTL